MTDNTQPEALAALIARFRGLHIDHEPDGWPAVRTREITALLDRIAELEAQLEAIGAGGVSALMGAAKAGSEPEVSYAIRLLVAADLITQAKADEALRLAAGITAAPGPADGESNV